MFTLLKLKHKLKHFFLYFYHDFYFTLIFSERNIGNCVKKEGKQQKKRWWISSRISSNTIKENHKYINIYILYIMTIHTNINCFYFATPPKDSPPFNIFVPSQQSVNNRQFKINSPECFLNCVTTFLCGNSKTTTTTR